MKITKVEYWEFPLTLREPYSIAYHTVSKVSNIALILHTDSGISGFGCAGPEEEVTNETCETILLALRSTIEPLLVGRKVEEYKSIIREIHDKLSGQYAALALVDMALFDALSKEVEIPLFRYLGAERDRLETSITVYLHSPEETVARVKGWLERGFSLLKLKGGLSVEDDIAKVHLLRKEIGKRNPIIFDANQGYSYEEALYFAKSVEKLNITCVEQPTDKDSLETLIALSRNSPISLMADESLKDIQNAKYLAESGIGYFNIKLMKSGGIYLSTSLASIASEHSVKVIVSCMDECAFVNAAGLHFSLATPNVEYVDLDSFTDYSYDPTRAAIHFQDGYLIASDSPGIGFDLSKIR